MRKTVSVFITLCIGFSLAACASASSASSGETVSSAVQSQQSSSESQQQEQGVLMRVAGLKGPTTMGMVKLMQDAENGTATNEYQVEMYATAQEIVPKIVQGEIDAALLPANVASTLYHQTEGKIQVAAINTLGVLYVAENGDSIQSVKDLKGKTIYSTGKNNTPEYTLNYILTQNGIDPTADVTVEYKSEATEVAAMLAQERSDVVAVLPQPYVTIAASQNQNLRVALDLTEEWEKVNPESSLVTGVLVINREFAKNNAPQFEQFLQEYKQSIEFVNSSVEDAAKLVVQYGIVPKEPIAQKAIPECNMVYIDGQEMKTKLQGYLQVLMEQNEKSIGGALPESDFYYGVE